MITQPEDVTAEMFGEARTRIGEKDLPTLHRVGFAPSQEGPAAQITHVGPPVEEGPTVEGIHRFVEERGRGRGDRRHEIYRAKERTAPERLKTVVRQPFG